MHIFSIYIVLGKDFCIKFLCINAWTSLFKHFADTLELKKCLVIQYLNIRFMLERLRLLYFHMIYLIQMRKYFKFINLITILKCLFEIWVWRWIEVKSFFMIKYYFVLELFFVLFYLDEVSMKASNTNICFRFYILTKKLRHLFIALGLFLARLRLYIVWEWRLTKTYVCTLMWEKRNMLI